MKTLDEVIKAFEECIVPKNVFCNGCYKDDRCKITEDALNYLKQYRSDKGHWEADRKSYQGFVDSYIKSRDKHQAAVIELKHKEKEVNDILTDYVALKQYWAEQQDNPPLTWEELKQMEGKPVWVEKKHSNLYYMWGLVARIKRYQGHEYAIIKCPDLCNSPMSNIRLYDTMYLNDGWQAYRKERK